jgi:hypothetical protein
MGDEDEMEEDEEKEKESEEEDTQLSISSPPYASISKRKSGQSKIQKLNKKPSTEQKTSKASKGTLEKKEKQKTVPATQVIVSQHKAQERSGPPKSQPEEGTSASAASGNNVSVASFLANFEKEIWNFNGNFVPYALASLGPAMAEGGAVNSNREHLILATAVEMGLLSDQSVIRETQMLY